VGAAAVAREVVLADHGVRTRRRLHPLEVVGIPLARDHRGRGVYHRFPCDPELVAALSGGTLPLGTFATVVQVSGDPATAEEVARRWEAILEDMESAALAQLALHYRIPFAALRGVSNLAGRRELDLAAGAEAAQRALLAALGEEP
jgi:futalosine hydrolase